VYALTALHNFIQQHTAADEQDVGLDIWEDDFMAEQEDSGSIKEDGIDARRDEIAARMWKDYIIYKASI